MEDSRGRSAVERVLEVRRVDLLGERRVLRRHERRLLVHALSRHQRDGAKPSELAFGDERLRMVTLRRERSLGVLRGVTVGVNKI